jgi:hypothetical protein
MTGSRLFDKKVYNTQWLEKKEVSVTDNKIDLFNILEKDFIDLQIIFQKGEKIDKYNLDIEKMLNILHSVKFMQDNGFIFGDLKIENMVMHNGLYKIIDFSSIFRIDSYLNNLLNNPIIYYLNYYIHPKVIKLLIYMITFKNDYRLYGIGAINSSYDREIQNTFSDISSLYDTSFVNGGLLKDALIDIRGTEKPFKYLITNIYHMALFDIGNMFFLKKIEELRKNQNYNDINTLLKKIDMYSIGYIMLEKFPNFIHSYITRKDIICQYLKIICYFTLFYVIEDLVYNILHFTIDEAIAEYDILIRMINTPLISLSEPVIVNTLPDMPIISSV